jgi:hypothetical protein
MKFCIFFKAPFSFLLPFHVFFPRKDAGPIELCPRAHLCIHFPCFFHFVLLAFIQVIPHGHGRSNINLFHEF